MGMDLRCVLLIPADRYLRGAQRCAHSMAVPRCCMSRGAEALQQIQPMGGCAWLGVAVQGCFLGGLVCVPSFSRPAASAEGCSPGVCEALNALCSISSVKHYLLLLFFCFLFFFYCQSGSSRFGISGARFLVQLQASVTMATAASVRHGCALGRVQTWGCRSSSGRGGFEGLGMEGCRFVGLCRGLI